MAVKLFVGGLLVALLGGVAFLATWDMPPPTAVTEKVIPYERVP